MIFQIINFKRLFLSESTCFKIEIAICVLRAQSDTLSIERLFLEIDNVHLHSQHTQDFSYNRNYDYYILFYLDQINVIPF
jgi:hypothetical protein